MKYQNENESLFKAWNFAANELDLEIISPFIIETENVVSYPILVKNFGAKNGTIVLQLEHLIEKHLPKIKDFHVSALSDEYSNYRKDLFIETLEDWGYFGNEESKPFWYTGLQY
jgi:hypothetical protein